MRAALALLAVFAASAVRAETPDEVTAALARSDPALARLLATHPRMAEAWQEDFWADVLLRAPSWPGSPWRVHDLRRPQPRVVAPGRCRPAPAPSDAIHVFDGAGLDGLTGPRLDLWRVEAGALVSSGETSNRIASKAVFGDVQIHLEFRTPPAPTLMGQHRGNSGLFLMGLYEVQILDSWNNPTYADGQLGALYGQEPPRVNAAARPGQWQCLDVAFTAPRFDGERLVSPARATVWVNGVTVQRNAAFKGPTVFAALSRYQPHAPRLPFTLQDHGDPEPKIAFRNIWARPL